MGAKYRRSSYSIFAGTVSAQLAANTQAAWSPNGDQTVAWGNRNFVAIPICRAGVLQHLYVQAVAAPGAGETFDYNVLVNNVACGITVQLAGAVQTDGNDPVNQFAVVPGDVISIEINTSLNAAATWHKWSFELV